MQSLRRDLLRGGAVAVLATLTGCGAISGPADETRTPPPIRCESASRPDPQRDGGDVTSATYPNRPDSLGTDSAERYASEHETAFVRNRELRESGPLREFGLSVDDSSVTSAADGRIVHLFYHYYLTDRENVHADSPGQTVAYYIDARGVLRTPPRSTNVLNSDVDPLANGVPVACWEPRPSDDD